MSTAREDYPWLANSSFGREVAREVHVALDEIDRLREEVARLRELAPGV